MYSKLHRRFPAVPAVSSELLGNDVFLVFVHQLRQSFKPGEVSAEEANQIGYELAERLLHGAHAFIVATHTDRKHIQKDLCQGLFFSTQRK